MPFWKKGGIMTMMIKFGYNQCNFESELEKLNGYLLKGMIGIFLRNGR